MRHGKRLHRDVTDRELGASGKDSPVAVLLDRTVAANCFCRQRIAINRYIKFAAENFKSADVIAMFVREKNAIELVRDHAAMLQTQHQLSRAQPAIDKNLPMIGCDQRAVSRAPAAEHLQAEHGSKAIRLSSACANCNTKNNGARST